MSKRLYVGNLPFSVSNDQLKKIFESFGDVEEAIVVSYKDSGKSKGFGFVTLANDEQADKAISEMDGKEVEGRKLKVNEAVPYDPEKPRGPRFRRGGFGGGFRREGFRPGFRKDFRDGGRKRFGRRDKEEFDEGQDEFDEDNKDTEE